MTTDRRRWPIYLAILSMALLARGAAAVWWQSRIPVGERFVFGDSHSYWELATHVARGEPYQFGADTRIFRTPGYPIALAVVFRCWGGQEPPVLAARFWGALWGVAAVAATMLLAKAVHSDKAALIAGLIAALQPEAIASSVFVLSEATFMLPMLLQLATWAMAWKASTTGRPTSTVVGWSLLAGVAAGVATLMRPGWLLFIPWSIVPILVCNWRRRDEWRTQSRIILVMLVGLACTMAPWWWRNYQVTGRFVATTLQVGASLYDGLSPIARGGSDMRFVPEKIAAQRHDDSMEIALVGTFEERLDRRLRDEAVEWAFLNPGTTLRLAAIKLVRLWNFWPNSSEFGGWTTRLVIAAAYAPLLALAFLGAWKSRAKYPALALCLLPLGYLTSLHVVFVSSIRYRQPAIFVLAVLAAAAVCRWREREPR